MRDERLFCLYRSILLSQNPNEAILAGAILSFFFILFYGQ